MRIFKEMKPGRPHRLNFQIRLRLKLNPHSLNGGREVKHLKKTFRTAVHLPGFPKGASSTFAGLILILSMIGGVLPLTAYAETIKIGGTGSALGTMRILAQAYMKSNPEAKVIVLPSLGSSGGVRAMLSGVIDIALTTRPPKKKERAKGAAGIEYGRSPFVIATGIKNNASGMTTDQLADIFGGKTATWPDGSRIRFILRPKRDSDSKILRSISPRMRQALKKARSRPGMTIARNQQENAKFVETIPGALGTSVLALILSEKRRMKPLSFNGVKPSPRAIAEGTYPYFKRYHMVTSPQKPSALARRFIAFVRSAEGSEILTRNGHWVVGGNNWVARGNEGR